MSFPNDTKSSPSITQPSSTSLKFHVAGVFYMMRDGVTTALFIACLPLIIHTDSFFYGDFLFAILILSLATYTVYAFNDLADTEIDAINLHKKHRNPIVTGRLTAKQVKFILGGCLGIMYLASLAFDLYIIGIITIYWILGAVYSLPPLRLKIRPGFDLFAHAVLILSFPYFFMLIALQLPFELVDVLVITGLMTGSMVLQLNHQHNDREFDAIHETNLAVFLGARISVALILLLTSFTIIIAVSGLIMSWIPLRLIPIGIFYLVLISLTGTQNYKTQLWVSRIVRVCGWMYLVGMIIYFQFTDTDLLDLTFSLLK